MTSLFVLRNIWSNQAMPTHMATLAQMSSWPVFSLNTKISPWRPVVKLSAFTAAHFAVFKITAHVVVWNISKVITRLLNRFLTHVFGRQSLTALASVTVLRAGRAVLGAYQVPASPTAFIALSTMLLDDMKTRPIHLNNPLYLSNRFKQSYTKLLLCTIFKPTQKVKL